MAATARMTLLLWTLAAGVPPAMAQPESEASGGIADQAGQVLPAVEMPPRDFETAEAHYQFLLERADRADQDGRYRHVVERTLEAMARGEKPTAGPQNGRRSSEPAGGRTTLKAVGGA